MVELELEFSTHRYEDQDEKKFEKELEQDLLTESYQYIRNEEDREKFHEALSSIKICYAMGLTDKEIGELVENAKWDKETSKFTVFENKIIEIKKERSLSSDDIDKLLKIDSLRRQAYKLKSREIAQKAILKIVGENEGD